MTTSSEVSAVPFYNGSVVAEMDAADTADLRIDLNGGTLNADVIGDTSGEANTYFSGYQVG